MNEESLILASGSAFRARLLRNAGIDFIVEKANIDERAVEESLGSSGLSPADLAELLAQAKAINVSERFPDKFVIGADQTLSIEERILHKPENMEQARARLLELQGKTHMLLSAVVLVKNSEILWSNVTPSALTMRPLTPGYIGRHLARVGDIALTSVGAYQIEGEGVQLFQSVKGDMFSIQGLPLIELLHALREHRIVEG